MNTKKALLASEFEYGIKDNLKFNSKLSMDKIFPSLKIQYGKVFILQTRF